jgi:hypothetical protein
MHILWQRVSHNVDFIVYLIICFLPRLVAHRARAVTRSRLLFSLSRENDRYTVAPATANYQVSLRPGKFIALDSLGKYTRRAMSKHEKEYFFGDQRCAQHFN